MTPGLFATAIAAGAVLLVVVAGVVVVRVERHLLKRRLEVLDGTAGDDDIDLNEAAGGYRG